MARTAARVAAAAAHAGRAEPAAARPAGELPATAPAQGAGPRLSPADRHPAHWATRPLPVQSTLSRHAELLGRDWAPSIAYIDMTDIRVPDPGFEWRIDVCVRGNQAKGCPNLVLTALVTAVGEYLLPSERRLAESEFESESAAGAAPAPQRTGAATSAAVQPQWARRAPGWQARPGKRRCVSR